MPCRFDSDADAARSGPAETARRGASPPVAAFQAICNAIPVGLCLIDRSLRFVAMNRLLAQMTGRSIDESIGRGLAEVTPGVAAQLDPALRRVLEGERLVDLELRGTEVGTVCEGRVFLASLEPMPGPDGGVAAVLCTVLDITRRKRAELALRDSEIRFRGSFDQAAVGIAHIEFNAQWKWINRKFCEMLGYTQAELTAMTFVDLSHPEDLQDDLRQAARLRAGEISTYSMEKRYFRKDGSVLWGQLTVSLLRDEAGVPQNYVVFVEDISARKAVESALADSESRLKRAIAIGGMAAWEWDVASDDLYASASLDELLGQPAGSLRTMQAAMQVVHPDDRPAVAAAIALALQGGAEDDEVEFRVVWPDGTLRWLHARGRVEERNAGAPRVVGLTYDITGRKESEARITWLAHYDPLTRLANRTLFRQRLEQTLAGLDERRGMVALHWMDFDAFKCINDTLGHPAGDALLREAAARLQLCLSSSDLAARVGGDEFAVIQTGIHGPADAEALGASMLEAMAEPYEIEGRQLSVGASLGIALVPRDSRDPDEIVKKADIALYRAKADGGGAIRLFSPEMDAAVRRRQEVIARVRRGLAEDRLALHFQPLVSLHSGMVTCAEALLRGTDGIPYIGSVPEFISCAEEAGLIVPLGRWVLRSACQEAARWDDKLRVAVNLSPVQFSSPGLLAAVTSALDESGLPPERLELEITESVLLHHNQANVAILHQLRALGVRIALDDFGTGYASLSYLHRFPFDKIKIDQSFVCGLPGEAKASAIVRAVIGLGRSLGIAIAAEGVETTSQLESLRNEGCDEVQGFLLSRPVPADQIAVVADSLERDAAAAVLF
ncbi:MAG TPA: EAL domain-containing protein [Acetobacteraceae bacterium]|nr:EAL domain-containing protein [Acetobacteraceae bacterium]